MASPSRRCPRGTVFETDPNTALHRFILWSDLTQAGAYDFRFRAVDEKGASAEKMITVTVGERTGTPAILNLRGAYPMTVRHPEITTILPGQTVAIPEGHSFNVAFDIADPEGNPLTVTLDGLPKATLSQQGGIWYVEWRTSNWPPGSHTDVGLYNPTLTVTDSGGLSQTISFSLDVRWVWDHGLEAIYIRPRVQSGLIRTVLNENLAGDHLTQIVRGNITLNLQGITKLGGNVDPAFPVPSDLRYRVVLHTPNPDGTDKKTYLSDIRTGLQTVALDSTAIPDGTYAVDIEFSDGTDLNRLRTWPLVLMVDNTRGAVTGSQWVPVFGGNGFRARFGHGSAVGWVYFSGEKELAAVHPYPYRFVPPATDVERQGLTNPDSWFLETWTGPLIYRYDHEASFYRTKEGHLLTDSVNWWTSEGPTNADQFPGSDGGRNNASLIPGTNFRPNPEGPGFIGISTGLDGRLFRMDPDHPDPNKFVTTLAGYVTRSDVVPHHPWEDGLTAAERAASQKVLIGTFENGISFKAPNDLAVDSADPTKIYVADTGNHRIALVDLSGPTAIITTFAGQPGVAGYQDGPGVTALFNNPTSVEIIGPAFYVADRDNKAIRAIDLDTGAVTTLVGKGPSDPLPPKESIKPSDRDSLTWPLVPFADASSVYPSWIRSDSRGNLIVGEWISYGGESGLGNTRRVNMAERTVEQIARLYANVFEVDWRRNVGPVDDILHVRWGSHQPYRASAANGWTVSDAVYATKNAFFVGERGPEYGDATGSVYPISNPVIDDQEARFGFTSAHRQGFIVYRPKRADDPNLSIDTELYLRGNKIWLEGTVTGFVPAAYTSRPSLLAIHGYMGHNWLGNQPNFDDISQWPKSQRLAYYQSGMGGSAPRQELTGNDAEALDYFVLLSSLKGKLEIIPVPPKDPDARLSEIRNVQATITALGTATISWLTDEPTIGLIQYGSTDYYGLVSAIEPGYAKDHAITLTNLTQDRRYYFRIRFKDLAGNLTQFQGSFDVGTPPPARCADADRDRDVDVADVVRVIQAILGLKPDPGCQADVALPKGSLTLADALKILDVALGKFEQENLSCCGG